MNKTLIKSLTFATVFLLSLVIFSLLANRTDTERTADMQDPTLPVVSFYYGQTRLEELHGYVTQMETQSMRDGILPLDETREMTLLIDTYGTDIDAVSYQIRSTDGSRLVADASCDDFVLDSSVIRISFIVQNLLAQNEEYALVLLLETADGQEIYYYSRLFFLGESDMQTLFDFALAFHDATLQKDGDFLAAYMEKEENSSDSLSYVDLHSPLSQITWGNLAGGAITDPVLSVKEILSTYCVLTLSYKMSAEDENGQIQTFAVREYFRLRSTADRMYVLNFERSAEQIFSADETRRLEDGSLLLGITDGDAAVKSSEAGDKAAFVQAGDLFCYDADSGLLERVFSFRGEDVSDVRRNYGAHEISIVRMDEAGSLDFIVSGYQNCGIHEGEEAVVIYHYDAVTHVTQEQAYLPFTVSDQLLGAQIGQLLYENEYGILYLMLQKTVYRVDVSALSAEPVVSGLCAGGYTVSDSGRFLAWVDGDDLYSAQVLYLLDFWTEELTEIAAETDEFLQPVGFFGDDLVYGAALRDETAENAAGTTDLFLRRLRIWDTAKGAVVKAYEKAGCFLQSVTIEENRILLQLMRGEEQTFVSAGEDVIMDREPKETPLVSTDRMTTEIFGEQTILFLSSSRSASGKMKTADAALSESKQAIELPEEEEERDVYVVYAKGTVVLLTDSASDAVTAANEQMGVVETLTRQVVWARARSTQKEKIAVSVSPQDEGEGPICACISAMLQQNGVSTSVGEQMRSGSSPWEILSSSLPQGSVLDLSGCPAEALLYYVSCGSVVFVMTSSEEAMLLVGYDALHMLLLDPSSGLEISLEFEEAQELFSSAKSIFFACCSEESP